MQNVITVRDLTKNYNGLMAVDHINFNVTKGEVFGFLGPNGAGKTTTIRMLTGIIKPGFGQISIMGFNIARDPIKAKQLMGVVPEMSNAYIELSAWDNLLFMADLYGVPKKTARQRAEALLGLFDLYDRKDHKIKNFSKGMKQKIIIAMALMNEPEILFLDEPTSGLDVQSARLIRDIVRKLNKDGKTIFLSTHYMEEANELCNRVAIINHGKIAAIDAPEQLKIRIGGLQRVEVSFNKPADISELSSIPEIINIRKKGDKLALYTNEPGSIIYKLVDYSRANNLEMVTLHTLTPSLEDVFITLTQEVG
ncbi:MAG: ABC-2 type transport system ATP-binding protein [Candidatus Methanomarinus sp.]|nr:MAG: ABC-2 type transport system ATP-binding protein [ANME-2 cluster archaeon]KAF5424988.1 ABC-2 type transport system ATP-binding protein [ANME-2 cluster archaeon]